MSKVPEHPVTTMEDAEIERILTMTDDELIADTLAQGGDPEAIAAHCREIWRRTKERIDNAQAE